MCDAGRRVNGYVIMHAVRLGDKEVIVGENKDSERDERYLCSLYKKALIIGEHFECIYSGDYLEIMELFTERLKKQISAIRDEMSGFGTPQEPICSDKCYPDDWKKCIEGKVAALKLESLRPEYRSIWYQLVYVMGGNGASAYNGSSTCYCIELSTGRDVRLNRYDILGEIIPEYLPEWVKDRLVGILKKQEGRQHEGKSWIYDN